jgi:hypothetical protein
MVWWCWRRVGDEGDWKCSNHPSLVTRSISSQKVKLILGYNNLTARDIQKQAHYNLKYHTIPYLHPATVGPGHSLGLEIPIRQPISILVEPIVFLFLDPDL